MNRYRIHKILTLLFIVIVLILSTLKFPEMVLSFFPNAKNIHILIFKICFEALLLFLSIYYMFLRPLVNQIENSVSLQKKLLEIEMNNRAVIAALPDNIIRLSSDGTLLDFKTGQQDYLHSENNKTMGDILPSEMVSKIVEYLNAAISTDSIQTFEVQMPHGENEILHKECRMASCGDDSVIVFIRDVTEQKINENNLLYMSTHDVLTGIFNRAFFDMSIDNISKGRGFPVSSIIIDIDGLKEANDRFGHAAGDKLIRMMAKILKNAFRDEDIVARIGGDEFAVLLPKTDSENIKLPIERIYRCFENEKAKNSEVKLEFSVGFATASSNSDFIESLKLADKMMYLNKLNRKRQKMAN